VGFSGPGGQCAHRRPTSIRLPQSDGLVLFASSWLCADYRKMLKRCTKRVSGDSSRSSSSAGRRSIRSPPSYFRCPESELRLREPDSPPPACGPSRGCRGGRSGGR
jgi:hypothetical protein